MNIHTILFFNHFLQSLTVKGEDKTVEERPTPCNRICPRGYICRDSNCVLLQTEPCKEDGDCPDNQYCSLAASSTSVDSTRDDSVKTCIDACSKCPKFSICTGVKDHQEICEPTCATMLCLPGNVCTVVDGHSTCLPNCTYDQDCSCHQPCIEGTCRDLCAFANCSSGTECKSVDGKPVCVSAPVKCVSEKDCSDDQFCLDGVCTNFYCTSDKDCDDTEICLWYFDHLACQSPCDRMQCPDGSTPQPANHQCSCVATAQPAQI